MPTLHDLKKSLNLRSKRNWFGKRDLILLMNLLHEWLRLIICFMIWTTARRKDSLEIPLEEIHELVIIDWMTDNQPSCIAKGIKIPTVYDQWSWTPHNNSGEDHSLNKRKNDDNVKNSASDVEDQDICWRIAGRGMKGHQDNSKTQLMAIGVCNLMLPRIEEYMISSEQWNQPS